MSLPIPLIVREPPQGATWSREALERSGLEFVRASLERELPDPPITSRTGGLGASLRNQRFAGRTLIGTHKV